MHTETTTNMHAVNLDNITDEARDFLCRAIAAHVLLDGDELLGDERREQLREQFRGAVSELDVAISVLHDAALDAAKARQ
jgi:hypothetical protein